jgi:hypothetical protein
MRRLLVPVVFALAVGACAALLCPAPARPPFALRVRLEFISGQGRAVNAAGFWGPVNADAALDDLGRRPGVQDQLSGLVHGRLGVPDKLNAMLEDPEFLQGIRYMLRCAPFRSIADDPPDPLPPHWLSSWASLEVEKDQRPLRYIDLVLRGDDPERLRRVVPAVVEVVYAWLARSHNLWLRGIDRKNPTFESAGELTWEPPADTAGPRRRLALSLSCLALAAFAAKAAFRTRRRGGGAK